jgi:tRNA/tmRNA/rRNA uracil-C5-methylase (TrmA/RlmC/RlmD family)
VKKSPHEQPIPDGWQIYGGCKWLPIPYAKQLEIKEAQIHEAFFRLIPTSSPALLLKEKGATGADEKVTLSEGEG